MGAGLRSSPGQGGECSEGPQESLVKTALCHAEGEGRGRSKAIVSLGTWSGSEVSRDVETRRPGGMWCHAEVTLRT